jgi:hypothetical protein
MTEGAAVDLHRLPAVAFQLDMAPVLLGVECMLPFVPALHGAAIAVKFGATQVTTLITIDVGHALAVQ